MNAAFPVLPNFDKDTTWPRRLLDAACHVLLFLLFLVPSAYAQFKPEQSVVKDISRIEVFKDAAVVQTQEYQVRAETVRGITAAGEQKISYNNTMETVEVLEAYTLLADGTRIDVALDKIRTQDAADSEGQTYDDTKEKVIIFPKVEVGSQVYYRVRTHQHTPLFPGHFFESRYFSPSFRYGQVEVHLSIDPSLPLQVAVKGANGGIVDALPGDQKDFVRYRWTFQQDVAFPGESGQVALSGFAPHIVLSTFQSWADVGKAYQDRALPQTAVTPDIKALALELTQGAHTPQAKARRIYHWVATNIRYLGLYVGAGGYVPHSAQSILDNRYGDCKDHAVILESLLRAVDIDSTPVLIHAGSAYSLPPVASPYAFNHVITYVPALDLYLDSTSSFSPMGHLPDSDMDKHVVHVATGRLAKTPRERPTHDRTVTAVKMKLLPNGGVEGSAKTVFEGFTEVESRARRFSQQHQPQERVVNNTLARFGETGTGEIVSPDPSDLDAEWSVNSWFALGPVVNLPGPSAMTIPGGTAPGRIRSLSDYVPPKVRRFPVVCGSVSHVEDIELSFESASQVQRIPQDTQFVKGSLSYESRYRLEGDTLRVKRTYYADRPGSVCGSQDDLDWRELTAVIKRDFRQQIFIK